MVYLDANATAPLRPSVLKLLSALPEVYNPSSSHTAGRATAKRVNEARRSVASSIGAQERDLFFTSGGTEANQTVIRSVLTAARDQVPGRPFLFVTFAGEHDATLQMAAWAKENGGEARVLPITPQGFPSVQALRDLIQSNSTAPIALVSVMWVNNETGVVSPLADIIELCRQANIPVHVDGAQAWGKWPVNVSALGAQWVTFSAHKIGAPAGTGVIWGAHGQSVVEPLLWGKQEKARRGGTENTLGILCTGAAAAELNPTSFQAAVEPSRNAIEQGIVAQIKGAVVNGQGAQRVPNTLSVSFTGIETDGLVAAMDLAGYCVSAGSACSSGVPEASHVLSAMGIPHEVAIASLRISLWSTLSPAEVTAFVSALAQAVERLRTFHQEMKGLKS